MNCNTLLKLICQWRSNQNLLYSFSNRVCLAYLLKVVCFVYCLFIWLRYIAEHMPKWNAFKFHNTCPVCLRRFRVTNIFYLSFSNSLIIYAALTQPEHLILVRWMSLETQWKPSWKHGRAWKPCVKLFETRMQIFLICILIKQQKHVAINNYLITHFT